MLEQKIVENSSIWDLHIHTCKCPKGNDEFSKLSVKDYVDGLVKLFKNYPLLKMISFTDHNFISEEVYNEFISKNTGIEIIYGIEVDTYLSKEDEQKDAKHNNYKHVIFISIIENLN